MTAILERPEPAVSWLERAADFLNPILVRETRQALRSRAFTLALGVSLASIVVLAVIATSTHAGAGGGSAGRQTFVATLDVLLGVALLFVPMQAFGSMRREVLGGTAEMLLLTELTPRRIVLGKLAAAAVQLLLFASVFGPMMAVTFLLRGVDVPSIAFYLVMTLLAGMLATAVALGLGALSRLPLLSVASFGVAAIVLGVGAMAAMGAVAGLHLRIGRFLRDPDFWLAMGAMATIGLAALVLMSMVASSILTHPFENRSTGFRLFAVAATVVGFAWIAAAVPSGYVDEAAPTFAAAACGVMFVFTLVAATEDERLSPRVATLVPRSRPLAWLAIPFLPGGSRGLWFAATALAIAMAGAIVTPWPFGRAAEWRYVEVAAIFALYTLVYTALARLVRGLMRPGPKASWQARGVAPAVIGLGMLLPSLISVLAEGRVGNWSLLHVSNPFWTLVHVEARSRHAERAQVLVALCVAAVVLLLLNARALRAGAAEVLAASRKRRA